VDLLIAAIGIAYVVYWIGRFVWKERTVRKSLKWPGAEAMIQSGQMGVVYRYRLLSVVYPRFSFSYVVAGESYSGSFSLETTGEVGASLTKKLLGRKYRILYDPENPKVWYLPDSKIEGHRVHQKLEPTLLELYPRN
jgi:hypothetical protein